MSSIWTQGQSSYSPTTLRSLYLLKRVSPLCSQHRQPSRDEVASSMRSPWSGWGWLWMQQATPSITGFQGLPLKCHPVTWFHVGTSPDHASPSSNNLPPSREGQVDEWEERELTRFPFMFNRCSSPSNVMQTENKRMRENTQSMHHWTVSSF